MNRIIGLLLVVGLLGGLTDHVAEAASRAEERRDRRIEQLVWQLGSTSWRVRRRASRELAAIGKPAAERLRAAAKKSADLEVRMRAERVLTEIFPPKVVAKPTARRPHDMIPTIIEIPRVRPRIRRVPRVDAKELERLLRELQKRHIRIKPR